MQGDSIAAARRALQAIIAGLREGERFSLSRFGSTVEHRSRALWRTSPATRLAGQRWAAGLQADLGGTEMEKALDSTLALAGRRSGKPRCWGRCRAGRSAAHHRWPDRHRPHGGEGALGHRVFVVGIGNAPAEGVLRRLAEETGGACDFVAPGEAVEPAVLRMFARLRSQRMASPGACVAGRCEACVDECPTRLGVRRRCGDRMGTLCTGAGWDGASGRDAHARRGARIAGRGLPDGCGA